MSQLMTGPLLSRLVSETFIHEFGHHETDRTRGQPGKIEREAIAAESGARVTRQRYSSFLTAAESRCESR